jgi:anti-sigma regulatory factor (Ser/Thr protein kinase)
MVFTARLDKIEEVRTFLVDGLPNEYVSLTPSVDLIIEEFLVNVVNHAYKGQPGPLEVSLRQVDFDDWPHLAVKIMDWGPPFNPFEEAPQPDLTLSLEEKSIGGLGIHLVRHMIAHNSYSRERGANTVEVWIKRP